MKTSKNTLEVLYDGQKEKIASQNKESRENWKKQTNRKNDTLKSHKNKEFLSFHFDKLKDILSGEDKFFRENTHFKTPIIILTATILLLIYIGVLILVSTGLSFLLLLGGVPYSNIISVVIVLFALIFIIILHVKNRNKVKEAIK